MGAQGREEGGPGDVSFGLGELKFPSRESRNRRWGWERGDFGRPAEKLTHPESESFFDHFLFHCFPTSLKLENPAKEEGDAPAPPAPPKSPFPALVSWSRLCWGGSVAELRVEFARLFDSGMFMVNSEDCC